MARRLRFIPEGGALVEVTCRTIQGRFLLHPTEELNSIIIGVLARAARRHPVEIHALVFLSNHYHLLLSVEDALQLACFMNYLNSNIAREAGASPFTLSRFSYDIALPAVSDLEPKTSYTILMRVLNDEGQSVSEEEGVRFEWPEVGFSKAAPKCRGEVSDG